MNLQAIVNEMFRAAEEDGRRRAERIALDGAIALAATDGERGVSCPRELLMVHQEGQPLRVALRERR